MKWTNNSFRVKHTNKALKHIFILLAVFALMACVSTEEFEAANNVNRMDNNLTTLLIEASTNNNTQEKKQIAYLAEQALDSGNAMAIAGSPKVALAFYRIAAVGFWRDDIRANDNQLFAVIDTAKGLCDSLKAEGKAPDRDCFVIQLAVLLEVLENKYEEIAKVEQLKIDDENVGEVRVLLDELGFQTDDNNAKPLGFLIKFVSVAKNEATFLKNHPSMYAYMKETLFDVTMQYKKSMVALTGYYDDEGMLEERITFEATHPVFTAYLSRPEQIDRERINSMVDEWLRPQ